MKPLSHIALCVALAAPLPALAQETEQDGSSAMERGLRLFLDGLMDEMGPALDGLQEFGPELRNFMAEMGPSLRDLMGEIKDWSVYKAPEVLPNGDIIIRRKPKPAVPEGEDQIDI